MNKKCCENRHLTIPKYQLYPLLLRCFQKTECNLMSVLENLLDDLQYMLCDLDNQSCLT